jgi:hypothetical protein
MLTRAEQELITAAIDGELSPDDAARFRRLTTESSVALALYTALVRDRDRLRGLPRVAAPPGLAAAVIGGVRPAEPRRKLPERVRWLPIAVAASFLLAVAGGTYFLAGRSADRRPLAQTDPLAPQGVVVPPPEIEHRAPRPEPRPVAPLPRAASLPPSPVAKAPSPQPPLPAPPAAFGAAPGDPAPELDLVQLRLPVLLPVADLYRDDAKAVVRAELARDPAFRIDLFARDTNRAAELLTAAGKAVRLTVLTEAVAGERLKRKFPSAWAVFTDALTPDEVAKWLAAVAAADEKASAKSPAGRVFESAHVVPAQPPEQREARDLFGIDLGPVRRSRSPTTPPKAVSAGTADQVASALQKGADKPAVLVTYLPPAARVNPAVSKELKAFHDRRGERKPGTVAVIVVIRPAG